MEALAVLERILHAFPVKVCAECRMVYDSDSDTEWHRPGCVFVTEDRATEVIGYRSLFEAQAAGVIYTAPPQPIAGGATC